jgi:hypothetical protein
LARRLAIRPLSDRHLALGVPGVTFTRRRIGLVLFMVDVLRAMMIVLVRFMVDVVMLLAVMRVMVHHGGRRTSGCPVPGLTFGRDGGGG